MHVSHVEISSIRIRPWFFDMDVNVEWGIY